jgi:hypothetical protein
MIRTFLCLGLALAAVTARGEVQLVLDGQSFTNLSEIVYDAGPRRMSLSFQAELACRPSAATAGFGLLTLAIGGQEVGVSTTVNYLAGPDDSVLTITTAQGPLACITAAIFRDRFSFEPASGTATPSMRAEADGS